MITIAIAIISVPKFSIDVVTSSIEDGAVIGAALTETEKTKVKKEIKNNLKCFIIKNPFKINLHLEQMYKEEES